MIIINQTLGFKSDYRIRTLHIYFYSSPCISKLIERLKGLSDVINGQGEESNDIANKIYRSLQYNINDGPSTSCRTVRAILTITNDFETDKPSTEISDHTE